MDSKKSSIRYLVHLLLIILFILTLNQLIHGLEPESFNLDFNVWMYYGVRKAIGIVFGMILALEYLHHEREKNGRWKINPYRLLILGVPALVFSFQQFVSLYLDSTIYLKLFEVMVGYILGTSMYKTN